MPETQSPNFNDQFVTETIPVGFPWRLFVFSLTLFIFSLFIFFGLKFGYETYLDQTAEDLDRKIEALSAEVSDADQESFINFYSQLVNLKKVLDRHPFTANVFPFLERNTLGEVYYTDADFSASDGSIVLEGAAASSETLTNQLALFDNAPQVERVVLDEMRSERNDVSFSITLIFNPDFFKTPSP